MSRIKRKIRYMIATCPYLTQSQVSRYLDRKLRQSEIRKIKDELKYHNRRERVTEREMKKDDL